MTTQLAYLNGQFVPAAELTVPVYDTGFVQGVTVAEQMRTFGGRLFRLEQHLARLDQSLMTIGVKLPVTHQELVLAAERLVANNAKDLDPNGDLGLSLFVTPGPYSAFAPPEAAGPTWAMHTYPVAFRAFASKYRGGESLAVTSVRQVPGDCWPSFLKCRSRMHYYLADREARERVPGARALLLDHHDFVTEASTANVLIYSASAGIVSPPISKILPGISLATLSELAASRGIPFGHRDLRLEDLLAADEIFLCSTSPCILPVTLVNGQNIGSGRPGPMFETLIKAWSDLVGLDIRHQAETLHRRDRIS